MYGNGVYSPIGKALANLGQSIASRPTKAQIQQQDLRTDLAQQTYDNNAAESTARGNLAAAFENPQFGADQFRGAAANAVRSGYKPSDLAELFQALMANTGAPDDVVARARVGAGKTIGVNDAVSLDHQAQIADRNASNKMNEAMGVQGLRNEGALAVQNARPLTEGQVKGGLLAQSFDKLGELDPHQRQVLGANTTSGGFTPQNYQTPDGQTGTTLDGRTDAATGEPLPQGSMVAPGEAMELTNSNKTAVQSGLMEMQDFEDTIGVLREVASSDSPMFGLVGNVARGAQGLGMQLNQLDQLLGSNLGEQFGSASAELAGAGVTPDFYDPNLSDIEKLATLTAYKAAAAVAAQSGRSLSDKDFQNFRQIIGDPTAWSMNQQSFLSGLDRIEQLASQRARRLQTVAAGGPLYQEQGAAGGEKGINASGDQVGETGVSPATAALPPEQSNTGLEALTSEQLSAMSLEELRALRQQLAGQ